MCRHFLCVFERLQELAVTLNRPVSTPIALTPQHDPFYLGETRMRDAEWFSALYHDYGFGRGVHLRRIHYRIVSQEEPVLMPNGKNYENTRECAAFLNGAAGSARYAGLVNIEDFIDQKNPDPVLRLPDVVAAAPDVWADSGGLDIEIPDDVPVPELLLDAHCPTQPYHLEIWCEKSTIQWRCRLPLSNGRHVNRADRKAAKISIRDALRARAMGSPLMPQAQAIMLWIDWLRTSEGDVAVKRLLSWSIGTSLTVIAFHERIGTRTIQNRIDASLADLQQTQNWR